VPDATPDRARLDEAAGGRARGLAWLPEAKPACPSPPPTRAPRAYRSRGLFGLQRSGLARWKPDLVRRRLGPARRWSKLKILQSTGWEREEEEREAFFPPGTLLPIFCSCRHVWICGVHLGSTAKDALNHTCACSSSLGLRS
jgi:hypothetical protein